MANKAQLRTIHHLSSSGGTVISKAIAALPRVVLLSEMNPSTVGLFAPRDPYPQIFTNYPGLFPDLSMERIFRRRIVEVATACEAQELSLVIRHHSHSDFLRESPRKSRMRPLLANVFTLTSIATVRNPVDAWLGMLASGFTNDLPNFTVYCDRVKMFLDAHADLPLFRYEDFTAAPDAVLTKMAGALGLSFDPGYADRMDAIRVTGDSGRLRLTTKIKPLERRELSPDLPAEIDRPENRALLERLGYAG